MGLKGLEENVSPKVSANAADDIHRNTLLREINCHIRGAATRSLRHILKNRECAPGRQGGHRTAKGVFHQKTRTSDIGHIRSSRRSSLCFPAASQELDSFEN